MEPLPAPAVRILGVDPGTLLLGYGVLDAGRRDRPRRGSVLATPASWEAARRLGDLSKRLEEASNHETGGDAMEASFFGRTRLADPDGRCGMMLALAGRARLAVHDYPPATVKVAVTGRGAASKEQVGRARGAALPMPRIGRGRRSIAPTHRRRLSHLQRRSALRSDRPRRRRSAAEQTAQSRGAARGDTASPARQVSRNEPLPSAGRVCQ
jgi:crossover junction endodeoxyribonuclease RuvC